MLQRWEGQGNNLADLVIICDNAPCHSAIENAVAIHSGGRSQVLRLGPYSPMMNPVETIWAKIKTYVKGHIGVPIVEGLNLAEQRLQYLENLVDEAKLTITGGDCARAFQHSSTFHTSAVALEDMSVGT